MGTSLPHVTRPSKRFKSATYSLPIPARTRRVSASSDV